MVQIQKKRISRKQLKRTKRSRANRIIKRGGDRFYNINVTTVNREAGYVQRVHPMDTVLTLKKYISAEMGINMEDQRLTFNGSELDDGEILSESGIQNNSTVYVANISELFTITVTTIDLEATYTPRVHPMDTVLTLKHNIYGWFGIELDEQRITFNGRELDNEEILSECGIQENSTVYVISTSELFTITVTTIDLEATYTPRVHPMDTVLTLKHNIYGWFGIELEEQRITFNGKEFFDDEEILSRFGIQENSTVYVADVSDLFTITVRTVDLEESYTPQFHPMDTVFTLKNNIYDWFGIELDDQRITFNDIELDDDEFLSEYGIQENSTVYVEDISQR
jgi:predicted hotdog family 3-hydroxylacyl-ACP dehydratase